MPQLVHSDGEIHSFPDEATPEQIKSALTSSPAAQSPDTDKEALRQKILADTAYLDSGVGAVNASQHDVQGSSSEPLGSVPLSQELEELWKTGLHPNPFGKTSQEFQKAHGLVAGVADTLGRVGNFVLSPEGTALMAVPGLPAIGQAGVAAGFAVQGATDAPSALKKIKEGIMEGDLYKATTGTGQLALDAGMAYGGVKGVVKPVVGAWRATTKSPLSPAPVEAQGPVPIAGEGKAPAVEAPAPVVTSVMTTGETPSPELEGQRMLGNMNPRTEQPIIGKQTQPLTSSPEQSAAPDMRRTSSEAGAIKLPKELVESAKELADHTKRVVKYLRDAQKTTDLDRATMTWQLKRQQSWQQASELEKRIREAVPTRARQDAVSVFMESAGDYDKLKEWEKAAKGKQFKAAAKAAQTLTPEEAAIAGEARQHYDSMGEHAQDAGVLDILLENYVEHRWKLGNVLSGSGGRALRTSARFAKARTFNTFFNGDQAGFIPDEMAIGKLLPDYAHTLNNLIADRDFVRDIQGRKSSQGTPLVSPSGRVTSATDSEENITSHLAVPQSIKWVTNKQGELEPPTGYRVMPDQPALRKWAWKGQTEEGAPILMHGDLALHPDAYKRINAMVGESSIRKWARRGDTSNPVSATLQTLVRGADWTNSEIKRTMFGGIAPFHQVQEGTHAVGHGVTPWGHDPIDLINNPAQQNAVQKGGLMLLPDSFRGAGYEEGTGGGSEAAFMKLVGKAGRAGKWTADRARQYQEFLFHDYIPRLKFATYQAALDRNMTRYADEIKSGEMNEDDVKMLTGSQVNAAYGHLNYALLDRNPTVRHIVSGIALAPDFLEARSRFVGQALKSFAGSKAGNEQLKAIAKLALYQAVAAFTITQITGNKWDYKDPFTIIIGNRKYSLRSVPGDFLRAFSPTEARVFWSARASVPLSTAVEIFSGRNWRGEKVSATQALGDALANTVPLMARSAPGVSDLSKLVSPSSANDPVTPLEKLAGSAGLKISRESPIRHAQEMAQKWKKASGKEADGAVYPVSKYQQLRYALEDGDFDHAQKEYDKLAAKSSRGALKKGFDESMNKPFSGSAKDEKAFRDSLDQDDRNLLDLANERRKEIVRRFTMQLNR